jgi:hypothetical protein
MLDDCTKDVGFEGLIVEQSAGSEFFIEGREL